jgi:activating signal cointegrator 1
METLFETEIKYKVLTLWQPWASLLVIGAKKIETRPSKTNWTIGKGTYLIHAAKKWTPELDALSKQSPFKEVLKGLSLSLGCIIGSIEVISCYQIQVRDDKISYWDGKPDLYFINDYREIAFGDYREGRYAWICQNPKIFQTPIPYKNGQGYYQNYNGDINLLKYR